MSQADAGTLDPAALIASCRNPQDTSPVVANLPAARLAVLSGTYLPRGKGAVPRWIGRRMIGKARYALRAFEGFDYVGDGQAIESLAYYLRDKAHGQDIVQLCRALTGPNEVFYDIGANVGHVSLSMARSHAGARHIAIEPIPRLAAAITTAAARNRFEHLEVYSAALDGELGHTSFFVTPLSTHASLVGRKIAGVEELRIPTLTLDAMVNTGAIPPPNVIKLDVEGAEMRMMNGAEDVFREHRPTLLYECDQNADRFGHSPGDFMERLRGLGYTRFFRVQGLKRTEILAGETVPYGDFLAIDDAGEARLSKLSG